MSVFSAESSLECGRSNQEARGWRYAPEIRCLHTQYNLDLHKKTLSTIALYQDRSPPAIQTDTARWGGRTRKSNAPIAAPECSSMPIQNYKAPRPCSENAR